MDLSGRNPQRVIPKLGQKPVALAVRSQATCVLRAINLNNQARFPTKEVRDVAAAEHHLPTKRDAKLATTQREPQPRFRGRWRTAHAVSTLSE